MDPVGVCAGASGERDLIPGVWPRERVPGAYGIVNATNVNVTVYTGATVVTRGDTTGVDHSGLLFYFTFGLPSSFAGLLCASWVWGSVARFGDRSPGFLSVSIAGVCGDVID